MKPKFLKFIALAKEMADKSNFMQHKVGACIIYKNKIIAVGQNQYKSHPMQKRYNRNRGDISEDAPHYVHAEMDALNKAKSLGIDLSKAELYVYRKTQSGKQGLSRPCDACMPAIVNSGIKTVHYTTKDGYATEFIDCAVHVESHSKCKV